MAQIFDEPYLWNAQIEYMTGEVFGFCCPFCRENLFNRPSYARAHIYPVGYGIGLVPGNIVLACKSCNSSMGHKTAPFWCAEKGIDFQPINQNLHYLRVNIPEFRPKVVRNFRLEKNLDGVVGIGYPVGLDLEHKEVQAIRHIGHLFVSDGVQNIQMPDGHFLVNNIIMEMVQRFMDYQTNRR